MDAVQAQRTGKIALPRGTTILLGGTAMMIVIIFAVLAFAMLSGKDAGTALTPARPIDPLSDPAAVEFRRTERSEAPSRWTGDPLSDPAAVEFRRTERSEAPSRWGQLTK